MPAKRSNEVHIAVLPFENASQDRELDYFVEGLYDDFIMDLSRFRALQIIAQKSVAKAMSQKEPSAGIQDLDADFIIKGKVRKMGGKVRVYIQLESAQKEVIIWTERFEADTGRLFDMQEEMLQRLSNSIQQRCINQIPPF